MTKLETDMNITEWPSPQNCTVSVFGGDALQRNAMLRKSSFVIIDKWKMDTDNTHRD